MTMVLQKRGIRVTTDNKEVVEKSQIVWLAVKPHAIKRTIEDIAPVIRPDYHLIVSAAAGIPIKTMEKVCTFTTRRLSVSTNIHCKATMHACVYTDYYDFDSLCKNKHLLQSHNACMCIY